MFETIGVITVVTLSIIGLVAIVSGLIYALEH